MIKIENKSKCHGCHACVNVCPVNCIEMKCDNEGFWYPYVDESKCINCNLCEKSCSMYNKINTDNTPFAYAGYNKNENIRLNSSSGGVFTLLAEYVINQGGVVFGAVFDDNFAVKHQCINNDEELYKLRGSKYTQSLIGCSYKNVEQYLKNGTLVLFTGTPCQIGGLKLFLKKHYNNLICQDIICHGVPSPKLWEKYIKYRESISKSKVTKINFRDKRNSWKKYSIVFEFDNKQQYCKSNYEDLYMKAFLTDTCLRPSCYECDFKQHNRISDITLADFWGIQNMIPEMDDDKGTSLIIINSEKGNDIFNKIKDELIYKETDLDKALTYNPAMIKSAKYNKNRTKFFNDLDILKMDKLVKKYCYPSFSIKIKNKFLKVIKKAKKALK